MDQIYVLMLIALCVLAVTDLMVGVSNDAVNFLNSAIGSKAVSFKTIMIVSSIGIAVGALFSSGMMEIARNGIFNPGMFTFNDVMIIFLSVMITDVLLLDVFNSKGLPTSTTVSVIFSLLGASLFLAAYKVISEDQASNTITNYINIEKASEIVYSILLSVLFSFSLGSFVQYISRMVFTFHIKKKKRYAETIFGGIAMTAIIFFILIDGLRSVVFIPTDFKTWINTNQLLLIGGNFIFWIGVSYLLVTVIKINIFKFIIIVGTFGLALAFAGNDLVNFIGVPVAAYQAYELYATSSLPANQLLMSGLANNNLSTPFYFLLLAALVMIITLWKSKKAHLVIQTEMSLARQTDGPEVYKSNALSRYVVRSAVFIGNSINYCLPQKIINAVDQQFKKPEQTNVSPDQPAFDLVRASVNLLVSSVLIAIGTSMKLPLSTTYVTFMVAMGSSFADRAWDRESAVYRIAGVFNVIGGWFITALAAFLFSGLVAFLLIYGEVYAFVFLMIFVALFFYRSNQMHAKKITESEALKKLQREDIVTINEIIDESSNQILEVLQSTKLLYTDVVSNLGLQDLNKLKENKKRLKELEKKVDNLKGDIYYFIKNLDETSVEASRFYILILGYLHDMVQSANFIIQSSHSHVSNNHKQLKFNQIRDLKSIDSQIKTYFEKIELIFEYKNFNQIDALLKQKTDILNHVEVLIQKQIFRIRTVETSPTNSKLYFGLLLETNDLIKSTVSLLELFKEFHNHVKSGR